MCLSKKNIVGVPHYHQPIPFTSKESLHQCKYLPGIFGGNLHVDLDIGILQWKVMECFQTFIPLYRARDRHDLRQEWSYSDFTNSWRRWILFLLRHWFQDQAQGYASTDSMLCTEPSHQSYAATELIPSINLLKASSYLQLKIFWKSLRQTASNDME